MSCRLFWRQTTRSPGLCWSSYTMLPQYLQHSMEGCDFQWGRQQIADEANFQQLRAWSCAFRKHHLDVGLQAKGQESRALLEHEWQLTNPVVLKEKNKFLFQGTNIISPVFREYLNFHSCNWSIYHQMLHQSYVLKSAKEMGHQYCYTDNIYIYTVHCRP